MGTRGWTESSIQSVIDKPIKTVVTKDTRFDTVSGGRLNDPATGSIAKDGSSSAEAELQHAAEGEQLAKMIQQELQGCYSVEYCP